MRKPRADSTTSIIKAISDASKGELLPPGDVKMTPEALPYWKGIIPARARDEWLEVELVVAAQLAQCQADIEEHDALLRIEGSILTTKFETQIINPRANLIEQLSRRQMALMRTLRIGGNPGGETRNLANRRAIQKQAEKLRSELQDDDGLLA